jgi:hypothetical protein
MLPTHVTAAIYKSFHNISDLHIFFGAGTSLALSDVSQRDTSRAENFDPYRFGQKHSAKH